MANSKINAWDYIAYACSAVVYILPQYLLSSYLSAYYTDVALVAAGLVGTHGEGGVEQQHPLCGPAAEVAAGGGNGGAKVVVDFLYDVH